MKGHVYSFIAALILGSFAAFLAIASTDYINGISIGENVFDLSPAPGSIAIHVDETGTVTAFKGALIPNLHDRYGKPVYVKRVVLK